MSDPDIETNASEAYAEPLRVYLQQQNQHSMQQTSFLQELVTAQKEQAADQANSWAPLIAMGMALAAALGALALGSKELAAMFAAGAFGLPAFAKIRGRKRP